MSYNISSLLLPFYLSLQKEKDGWRAPERVFFVLAEEHTGGADKPCRPATPYHNFVPTTMFVPIYPLRNASTIILRFAVSTHQRPHIENTCQDFGWRSE